MHQRFLAGLFLLLIACIAFTPASAAATAETNLTITQLSPPDTLPATTETVTLLVRTNVNARCTYVRNGNAQRQEKQSFKAPNSQFHTATIDVQPDTAYTYRVTCNASGLPATTTDLGFAVEPEEITTYRLNLPERIGLIQQGERSSKPFSIFNNASDTIHINFRPHADCCKVWITQEGEKVDNVSIDALSEPLFNLNVIPDLNASIGPYDIILEFVSGDKIREQTVTVSIIESRLRERLGDFNETAQLLKDRILRYKAIGVDTQALEERYLDLQAQLQNARQAMQNNRKDVLVARLGRAELEITRLTEDVGSLALEASIRQNWLKWVLSGITAYIVFFLITAVLIPYYRIKTEHLHAKEQLENAIEARKQAEKQYFRREIDRQTFMNIMTGRQDTILELRGKIEELEEELENAIIDRITLENFLNAPSKAFREISRWLRNTEKKKLGGEQ